MYKWTSLTETEAAVKRKFDHDRAHSTDIARLQENYKGEMMWTCPQLQAELRRLRPLSSSTTIPFELSTRPKPELCSLLSASRVEQNEEGSKKKKRKVAVDTDTTAESKSNSSVPRRGRSAAKSKEKEEQQEEEEEEGVEREATDDKTHPLFNLEHRSQRTLSEYTLRDLTLPEPIFRQERVQPTATEGWSTGI
jgi:hypothetical protein